MDKNTTRHSERNEESSITRYKTEIVIVNVAWQSRHYVINSFRKLAYGKGLIWILRYAQNDGWVKTLDYIITGLSRKVNLARNDGRAGRLGCKKIAFTMAEILLSLTIIGVVAAITLPSLTGNINERTWNAQRKALYARMSQAISLMDSLNGYGIGGTVEQTMSGATKAFITNGLAKVYKINNICDIEHLSDCGITSAFYRNRTKTKVPIPETLLDLNELFSVDRYGTDSRHITYSQMNTYAAAFETQNGESIVAYYYPYCLHDYFINHSGGVSYKFLQPTMCANFIYDLNGKKGPNTVGMDVGFITVFKPTDSIVVTVSPEYSINDTTTRNFDMACRNSIGKEDVKAANIYELQSVFINREFMAFHSRSNVFLQSVISSTKVDENNFMTILFYQGSVGTGTATYTGYRNFYCIKRNN